MFSLKRKLDDAKKGIEDQNIFMDRWLFEAFTGMIVRYSVLMKISKRQKDRYKINFVKFEHGETETKFAISSFGTGYELLTFVHQLGAKMVSFEAADGYRYEFQFYGPIAYIERYKTNQIIMGPRKLMNPFFYFEPEAVIASEKASISIGQKWEEIVSNEIDRLTAEIEAGRISEKEANEKKRADLAERLAKARRDVLEKINN